MKRYLICFPLIAMLLSGFPLSSFAASGQASSGALSDSGLLWLVNFDHSIPSDYTPSGLRGFSGTQQQLRSDAAVAMDQLLSAMKSVGYTARLQSGYRSYATQNYLFTTRLKKRQAQGMSYDEAHRATRLYTAVPGTSEHQLGLAMDFSTNGTLSESFSQTPVGQWLSANSWRYGYILRYRPDKQSLTQIGSEPWHFRYVGIPHAQIMYKRGWCFEEYIAHLKETGFLSISVGEDVYEIHRTAEVPSGYSNVVDCSRDNAGGWIVTVCRPKDPWSEIRGHWSEPAFRSLLTDAAIASIETIEPDQPISRGQFAFLYASILEPAQENAPAFSDVSADSPYAQAIRTVAAAGFMRGSRGSFSPQRTISRQEAAVSIAAAIPGQDLAYLTYSDTSSIAGWAFQSVQKLSFHGIMQGSGNAFRPKDPLTWGQAAVLIHQLTPFLQQDSGVTSAGRPRS